MLATGLLILAVDTLTPSGYASQTIFVALTIIFLAARLFTVAASLVLRL